MKQNKSIAIFFYKILPTALLSRIFGYITLIPFPKSILYSVIKWYIKKFKIDAKLFIEPEEGYKNFNQFFTRKFKNGIRKIENKSNAIVSPVDGRIDQFGSISGTSIIQAKGIEYSLNDLLPSEKANDFIDGSFMTIYLSPADYHRIHSPIDGKITGFFNIPGKLLTVQDYMVKGYKGLFNINERIFTFINSKYGEVAVCKVGATNVGKISLSYHNTRTNKTFRKKKEISFPEKEQKEIKAGDEVGIFHLGSTVILLFEKDMVSFDKFEIGSKIKMGKKIGKIIK